MQNTPLSPEPPQPLLSQRTRAAGQYWLGFTVYCSELHHFWYLPWMNQLIKGKMQNYLLRKKRSYQRKIPIKFVYWILQKLSFLESVDVFLQSLTHMHISWSVSMALSPHRLHIPKQTTGCGYQDPTSSHSAEEPRKSNDDKDLHWRGVVWSTEIKLQILSEPPNSCWHWASTRAFW